MTGVQTCALPISRDAPQAKRAGNGDVIDGASALRLRSISGCDGVMVARGALGNPWIYRDIQAALEGMPTPPAPTLTERKQAVLRHIDWQLHYEAHPLGHLRRIICWYFVNLPGVAELRDRIHRSQSVDELRSLVHSFSGEPSIVHDSRRQ